MILDEKALLEALRQYFSARIGDREAFIERTLAQLDRLLPGVDPAQSRRELQTKQKRLLQKRSRWQELYANDLLTIEELRERLTTLDRELQEVARQLDAPSPPDRGAGYTSQIEELDRKSVV